MSLVNPFGVTPANQIDIDEIAAELQSIATTTTAGIGYKMLVEAREKVGKTFFGMSASSLMPENTALSAMTHWLLTKEILPKGQPVFVLDTERKAKKLRFHSAFRNKDIRIIELWQADVNHMYQVDPVAVMKKLYYTLLYIVQNFKSGTILIDSATDITNIVRKYIQYELVGRSAEGHELGELIPLKFTDWQVRDDIWGWMLPFLQGFPQHVIFTAREKEDVEFEPDPERPGKMKARRTGNWSARIHKDLPYNVDMHIQLNYRYNEQNEKIGRVGRFVSTQFDDGVLTPAQQAENPARVPMYKKEIIDPTFCRVVDEIVPISHGYLYTPDSE
jgi:hypothetical protein